MRKSFKYVALALAAALSACGGGGGSSGSVSAEYQITVRADKTQLPVNVNHIRAGQGVYSPFTTTMYVQATVGGQPIPGGADIFGCNVAGGLNSGALYYLDGDPAHEDPDTKVPLAYRSITLGSNAGGSSFHFHAGDQAGTARITCSVTDPRDSRQKSASVDITVGGATGRAASIAAIPTYLTLGTQGNTNNVRTSTAIQAQILDDANQPVPAAAKANLQVAIATGGASSGARLLSGSQSGSVVQVSTTGGVGLFSLASGPSEGTILLEMTADRFDNDVTNGIQDPIVQLLAMPVTAGNTAGPAPDPLALVAAAPPAGANGLPYSYAFSAKGGVAPYTWTALGGLPDGLSLSASGILSGTPAVKQVGIFQVAVRVTDSQGTSITGNFSLTIGATAPTDPANPNNVLAITSSGCGSDLCQFAVTNPAATAPTDDLYYKYALTVTGPGTGSAVWTTAGTLPSWLSVSVDGTLAVSWAGTQAVSPKVQDCKSTPFQIKATRGGQSTTRTVVMVVGSGAGTCAN